MIESGEAKELNGRSNNKESISVEKLNKLLFLCFVIC